VKAAAELVATAKEKVGISSRITKEFHATFKVIKHAQGWKEVFRKEEIRESLI
jgi:hypothetical protein